MAERKVTIELDLRPSASSVEQVRQGFARMSQMGAAALAKTEGHNAMAEGFKKASQQIEQQENALAPVLQEVFTLKTVWQEIAEEIGQTFQETKKLTEALGPQLVKLRALADLQKEDRQTRLKLALDKQKEQLAPTVKETPASIAQRQLVDEDKATRQRLAVEKARKDLAPEVQQTGLSGLFAKLGGVGEGQSPATRIGALKFAGVAHQAAGVGQAIGGPVGGAVSGASNALATGAAGFAAGGPIGAAIALAPMVAEKIKLLAGAPFTIVGKGLDALTAGMRELSGPLGAGGALLAGMEGLAEKVPVVGQALGGMVGSLKGFLETGVGLSKLFGPGTSERFEIVQQNVLATIGRVFTPIVEAMTDLTQLTGEFLSTVLPSVSEMREALSPLKDVFAELRLIFQDLAPILKDELAGALVLLKVSLKLAADELRGFRQLLEMFGFLNRTPLKQPETAARSISFSDADSAAKAVYMAAFKAGPAGPKGKPPEKSWLEKIYDRLGDVITAFENGPKRGGTKVGGFAGRGAAGLGSGVAGVVGRLARGAIQGAR